MAHTDRQPTDEVFYDIVRAAQFTWLAGDYHDVYIQEKIDHINAIDNYADNWYTMLGMMDGKNQMIFWHKFELRQTDEFLRKMAVHYGYFVPKEKV